jgi:hypothetical protein
LIADARKENWQAEQQGGRPRARENRAAAAMDQLKT